jgi:hypothetical protein
MVKRKFLPLFELVAEKYRQEGVEASLPELFNWHALRHFAVCCSIECAEALGHGVHSADVVLNILARQREPAPPANIMTPAALTLRHAPIADCARYDNLRRTI